MSHTHNPFLINNFNFSRFHFKKHLTLVLFVLFLLPLVSLAQISEIPSDFQFEESLYRGLKSDDVKYLQILLKAEGEDVYPEGLITGYYGSLTIKAVTNFQLKYQIISSADHPAAGYGGPSTRAKLNEILANLRGTTETEKETTPEEPAQPEKTTVSEPKPSSLNQIIAGDLTVGGNIKAPRLYQEDAPLVLQTQGSGNIIVSAAQSLTLTGRVIILDPQVPSTLAGKTGPAMVWVEDPLYVRSTLNVSGGITGSLTGSLTGNADTATALASNPTDCSANQFANAINAQGNLTCAALVDDDIPDTITASNYLPLAGGTLTGTLTATTTQITANTSNAVLTVRQDGSGNIVDFKVGATSKFVINNNGEITTGEWKATAIGTQYGGTGQDWSSAGHHGGIPYFSATGTMGVLDAGISGYYLKTQGTSSPPVWSQVSAGAGAYRAATKVVCAVNAVDTTNCDSLCDGSSDQTEINSAIAAGYRVLLSEGTFTISGTITKAVDNVTLEGQGKNVTTIVLANGASCHAITVGGNYWTIKNLTIDGNHVNQSGADWCGVIGGGVTNLDINHTRITDVRMGIRLLANTVTHAKYSNISISFNEIDNFTFWGVGLDNGGEWIDVSHNFLHDGTSDAGDRIYAIGIKGMGSTDTTSPMVEHVNISYNLIRDIRGSINPNALDSHGGNYINFFYNIIENCQEGVYMQLAQDVGVGITENHDWSVIGNTIASTTRGIYLDFGNNSENTTIRTVTISNNQISNNSEEGIRVQSSGGTNAIMEHVNINNNIVREFRNRGITVSPTATGATFKHFNISDNIVSRPSGTYEWSTGIYLFQSSSGATVTDILVADNEIDGAMITGGTWNLDTGISIWQADRIIISGGVISNTKSSHININDGDDITIANILLTGTGGAGTRGITCLDGDDLQIIGARIDPDGNLTWAIDITYANVVRPRITNCNWQGTPNGITWAAATDPFFSENVDKNGNPWLVDHAGVTYDVWVSSSTQNQIIATVLADSFVEAELFVREAFNSDGSDEITAGYDADTDAIMTAVDVSSTGRKTVTYGVEGGYMATGRSLEAYYVNGGTEPTTGKAQVKLRITAVSASP